MMSDSEQPNDTLDTSRNHPEEERDSVLPTGTVERILSDQQRRTLCEYLEGNPVATMDELIDLLSGEDCSDETALIRLHHIHLPMLEDYGILTYEVRSETVRYWGHESVERRIDLCRTIFSSGEKNNHPITRT